MVQSGYVDHLRDGSEEGEDRFANLQELRSVAAQYTQDMEALQPGQTPLGLFLQEVSLVSDVDEIDEGAGAVTLLTLHMAKGLEYPVVFIVGMEEGILPHSRSLESGDPEDMAEERRLAYVGITPRSGSISSTVSAAACGEGTATCRSPVVFWTTFQPIC